MITPQEPINFSLGGWGYKLTRKIFLNKLDMKIGKNSVHKAKAIHSNIIYASTGKKSAESTDRDLKLILPDAQVPSADRVLTRIKAVEIKQMLRAADKAIQEICNKLKQANLLGKRVNIAIDLHDDPYYGDINNPYVLGSKRQKGTNYAHRYATVKVVNGEERITLGVLPVSTDDEKPELLKALVNRARKYVQIHVILLDRGFFNIECIRALKQLRQRFIMPAIRDKRIKKAMKEHSLKLPAATPYTMGKGNNTESFNLCMIKSKKVKGKKRETYGFATNLPISEFKEEAAEQVKQITETYRQRWDIETGYRVGNDFLATTTSRSIVVRLLYFLMCVLLYNIWALANALNKSVHLYTSTLKELIAEHIKRLLLAQNTD